MKKSFLLCAALIISISVDAKKSKPLEGCTIVYRPDLVSERTACATFTKKATVLKEAARKAPALLAAKAAFSCIANFSSIATLKKNKPGEVSLTLLAEQDTWLGEFLRYKKEDSSSVKDFLLESYVNSAKPIHPEVSEQLQELQEKGAKLVCLTEQTRATLEALNQQGALNPPLEKIDGIIAATASAENSEAYLNKGSFSYATTINQLAQATDTKMVIVVTTKDNQLSALLSSSFPDVQVVKVNEEKELLNLKKLIEATYSVKKFTSLSKDLKDIKENFSKIFNRP